jgi:hypothetical protein
MSSHCCQLPHICCLHCSQTHHISSLWSATFSS